MVKTLAIPVIFLSAMLTPRALSASPADIAVSQAAQPGDAVVIPQEPGDYAVLYTSMGDIVCRLFRDETPKAVSNFVGLATGKKGWTDPSTGKLVHRPLYSGTTFHRIIPGFMIQGGDPVGDGSGGPGFAFDDEVSSGRKFDRPGLLAMANSGPNTNGSQFFITVGPAEHLDGKFTLFGEVVSGQEVADAISKVPTNAEDRPETPVKLIRIAIKTVTPAKPSEAEPKH